MTQLEAKLSEDFAKPRPKEVTVVACRFPFPSWTPNTTIGQGIDKVWLYKHS